MVGVSQTNLASINDALASASVSGASVGTTGQVQDLVHARQAILALADGLDNTVNVANPGAAQYGLVGVTGIDTRAKASLLGDVIDIQLAGDVDTTAEIQHLADAVMAVMAGAAQGTPPSLDQLLALRLINLSADNLASVQNAIANTADDGSGVDTLQKLQAVVNSASGSNAAALSVIGAYADVNTISAPATPTGTAPTVQDYANAGVVGVTEGNLAQINDALATADVTRTSVDTSAKVQALVNAYVGVLALADEGVACLLYTSDAADE